MIYKTLNNWVAKAFITELSQKNYISCIYIYMNNYQILKTHLWDKLLWYFFNIVDYDFLYNSLRDFFLRETLTLMFKRYEEYIEVCEKED